MSCEKQCGEDCGPSKLRLHYFNVRARGELIRYLLAYAKADWEDCRYEFEEWPKVKETMPLGQMPVLECLDKDGNVMERVTQSATIARAVACKFGLMGKNKKECVRSDEAMEIIREIPEQGFRAFFEKDEDRKTKMCDELKNVILPRNLGYLEKRVQENAGKNLSGGECFTIADLAIGVLFNSMECNANKMMDAERIANDFPGLAALGKKVNETPEIEAYLAKRPKSDM